MAKSKQRVTVDGSQPALRQSLAGLAALRDRLPAPATPAQADQPASAAGPSTIAPGTAAGASVYARAARIVVRRERKGHGGKTATRIEGIAGSTRELEATLRELKRALGCGATLDGGDIVIQGAPGERLVAFLEGRGARKVVVGS